MLDSALRLNVHFHSIVIEGVYGDEEDPILHETPAPCQEDLGEILTQGGGGGGGQALAGLASSALMGPRTIGAKAAAWITHLGRDPCLSRSTASRSTPSRAGRNPKACFPGVPRQASHGSRVTAQDGLRIVLRECGAMARLPEPRCSLTRTSGSTPATRSRFSARSASRANPQARDRLRTQCE